MGRHHVHHSGGSSIVGDIMHGAGDVGGVIGGAVGHGLEAVSDGSDLSPAIFSSSSFCSYNTFEDVEHHQYLGAVENGAKTLWNGAEAVVDGIAGDWF